MFQLKIGRYFIKRNFLSNRIYISDESKNKLFIGKKCFFKSKIHVFNESSNEMFFVHQELSLIKKNFIVKNNENTVIGYIKDINFLGEQKENIGCLKENKVYLNALTSVRNVEVYDVIIKDEKIGQYIRDMSFKFDFIFDYMEKSKHPIDERLLIAMLILLQ